MKKLKRFNIQKILADPDLRRRMVVRATIATQAREGIDVTEQEAENSYYVVTEGESAAFFGLVPFRSEAGENDGRHVEFVRCLSEATNATRTSITLKDFEAIDGMPLSYSNLSLVGTIFRNNSNLDPNFAIAAQGLATADDSRFVHFWWEVPQIKDHAQKWFPFAKGGGFSRFYADIHLTVLWENNGEELKSFPRSVIRNPDFYFHQGLTWPRRTAKGLSVRILPEGCIFADKGPGLFPKDKKDANFLLALTNSRIFEFLFTAKTSFSWEVGIMKTMPVPGANNDQRNYLGLIGRTIFDIKFEWDTGNEICTRFDRPWVLQTAINGDAATLSAALDAVLDHEAALDVELENTYAQLNDAVYRLYGVNDKLKAKLEAAIGQRPPEIVWPQMENKDRDQKRREHVDRLLCYLVKRIVEADEDGLVCFESVAHEPPLLARLRKELSACFPQQDPSTLETEVVNELKKKTKGYRRAETLTEWLQDAFFDTHTSLYQQRPLIWHLASNQVRRVPAIGVLVHAHKFNADALAKLRGTHLRDRLATLRREAGQASQDGREDDRLETLAAIEELEAYDAKLKHLQDGHYTGPEGGERDYRILTPWKSANERPQGWNPDLDDGIKVNIAPLARTNLLRRKLKFAEAEKED